jgi:iron complex transport system ATP-binding protein
MRHLLEYSTVSNVPIFELVDATLMKDDRRVLDGLSLTIRAGEHTAILGPNGAGKSLLVSLLMHRERALAPADGSSPVRVLGHDDWNVFDLWPQLGFISADLHHRFVNGNSEGQITGEAAVLSGFLASQGILRYGDVTPEMRRKAVHALEIAGASHLASRRLNQMSSGEARRVLLARVLATSPPVLVLDEPTTGLDLVARHSFMEQVRGIVRTGTTLLLITHHIEEVIPEVERVILLREGVIVADGPTRSILTAGRLSDVFGQLLVIDEVAGYRYARPSGC